MESSKARSVASKPWWSFHTFVVTNTSSRARGGNSSPEPPLPDPASSWELMPRATPVSFPYMAAVSKWRYPAASGVATRPSASAAGTLYSPKPSWSISTPLFRLSRGEVLMATTLPTSAGQALVIDEAACGGFVQDQVGCKPGRQCSAQPVDLGDPGYHADPAAYLPELGQ